MVGAPDYQLERFKSYEKHTRMKLILVRNDTWKAVELKESDVGSVLVCVTGYRVAVLQPIGVSLFKEYDHRLVRCRFGRFHFSNASA